MRIDGGARAAGVRQTLGTVFQVLFTELLELLHCLAATTIDPATACRK
jgi:hypothetical protein